MKKSYQNLKLHLTFKVVHASWSLIQPHLVVLFQEGTGKDGLSSIESAWKYESAIHHEVPAMETFIAKATAPGAKYKHDICFIVRDVLDLNLLGRSATKEMGISVDKVLNST